MIKRSVLLLSMMISIHGFSQGLKITVKKGDKYKVQTTTSANSSGEVFGQTLESTVDAKTNTVYEVADIKGKDISMTATLTKMDLTVNGLGKESKFDSEKKDNDPNLEEIMRPLVNKKREVTVNSKGILNKDNEADPIADLVPGSITNSLELVIPSFIGRELKAGKSFSVVDSMKTNSTSVVDSGSYSVTAIDKGIALINYKGTKFTVVETEQMGMSMTTTDKGKVVSEIKVDMTTGLLIEKTVTIESVTSTELSGMVVPGTSKTVTNTKVSKKD